MPPSGHIIEPAPEPALEGVVGEAGALHALLDAANAAGERHAEQAAHSAEILIQAEAAAEAAARARTQFMVRMSDEIGASLRGVLAVTELLERQPTGADAPGYVRTIADAGRTLLRLLSDAVDLSHADCGDLALAPEPVHLRDFVDDVQARWTARAIEDGVAIGAVFDGDAALSATLDPARLHQVFDALIDHALRFTRRGGVEAGLTARRENERVLLQGHVRDTGRGIDPARLPAVFEPFAREASAAYGTGLGLAVARGVVEAMGGRVWAENNAGAGSTIRFELDVAACETQASEPAEPAREEPPPLQGHILIVDDNATNRTVARMLVEMFGCTCETAEDGLEGVGAVAEGRFDAVLMDIRMPGMDGVAATRAIRGLPGRPATIPIVALTANADQDDARAYRAAGMASVVEKPIKADRLLLALAKALSIDRSVQSEGPVLAAA